MTTPIHLTRLLDGVPCATCGQTEWICADAIDRFPGLHLIVQERARQVVAEGWTAQHDDSHNLGQLAEAAAIYATPPERRLYHGLTAANEDDVTPVGWPWSPFWWRPTPADRIRELVKAGAMIAAEIDRLTRFDDDERAAR